MSVPVGMVTVGVSAASGDWTWALLTVPAMVALSVTIGWIAKVGKKSRVFVAMSAGVGMLAGAAAGLLLIWFGIQYNMNADVCDPEVSSCRVIINGIVRGETTESVASQRFDHFLLSLAMILPGLLILFMVGLAGRRAVR